MSPVREKVTMLKSLLLVALAGSVFVTAAFAQAQPPSKPAQNPFDLTAARELIGDRGLATVEEVASLETEAQTKFESGDFKLAVDALDRYARQANALANLIVRGLQPYYGASYDARKDFSGARLIPFEKLANDYKAKRNRAMVMQAECFVKLGDKQKASVTFFQALGLIDIDDVPLWERARNGLYALVGVK